MAATTTWGKNSVEQKRFRAKWLMEADVHALRYKNAKASRGVLSAQQAQADAPAAGGSRAAAAAAGSPNPGRRRPQGAAGGVDVSPGGTTSNEKLEWAKKQRDHKSSKCSLYASMEGPTCP